MIALFAVIPSTLSAQALADRPPPELVPESVVVSPNVIDTSTGDQVVKVSLSVTDIASGLGTVKVTFLSPSGTHVIGNEVPAQPSEVQVIGGTARYRDVRQ